MLSIDEIEKLPLYSPVRIALTENILKEESSENEGDSMIEFRDRYRKEDISIIYVHMYARDKNKEFYCNFEKAIRIRAHLRLLYSALRSCKPYSLEELTTYAIQAITDSDDDAFYKWHSYCKYNLQFNQYDFSNSIPLCKKCLILENHYGKLICALNQSESAKYIVSFGYSDLTLGKIGTAENLLKNFFTNTYLGKKSLVECGKDYRKMILLLQEAYCFRHKIDVETALNLWRYDPEVLGSLGRETLKSLITELTYYFRSISDNDIILDYIDVITKKALNEAALKTPYVQIERLLMNCFDTDLIAGMYEKEFALIKKIILKQCEEMLRSDT